MTRTPASSRVLAGFVLAATAVLAALSRGKWSDPLIDSGREWIVPDALARGQLLYRDVVYWFGPLTPYLHGALFRLFGSSFSTLVLAGGLSAVAALAALYGALKRVTEATAAALWTALAIPALVFMPNAGGAILGMGYRIWHAATLSLLAILVVSTGSRRLRRIVAAGALCALAGLCRLEWGLSALSAAALVVARRPEDATVVPSRGNVLRPLASLLAGFLAVFGAGWLPFFAGAGWRSLLVEQPVFLLNIPKETRGHVGLAGLNTWQTGSWNLLYSASIWVGAVLAIELLVLRAEDAGRTRRRLIAVALALLTALGSAAMGGLSGPVLFGAAPLICVLALVRGWRGGRNAGASALAGFGWMGLLASHRRFFFIDDAPYVAPPLLFAIVCAAGLVHLEVQNAGSPVAQRKLAAAFAAVLLVVVTLGFAGRSYSYAAQERVPIAGSGGMLSARAETAREIEEVSAAIRARTGPDDGLIVFPEGELLNFLAARRNPIRHELYLPGYLTDENETDVVAELDAAKPAAIVVWRRPMGEYDRGLFGKEYGRKVLAWIDDHYVPVPVEAGRRSSANPTFTLYAPRGGSP